MSKRVHSFSDDVLSDFDGVGLANLIKNKSISPKEVIEATIKRAEKVEPALNAIVTKNFEQALDQSSKEPSGFFAGVPTFFKDLTCIEGLPNFFGTEAFIGATPEKKTDPIAKQILSMGFTNMGMSTMPEFGITCSTEFPNNINTLNPWNTEHSCGGSSGGAGVLVAAGVVPVAHTADGGGSTRIPASCCGLVGLKPTTNRLLLSSAFNIQAVKICVDGIVSRSVRDTAHFYHEAEKYHQDKKLPPIGLVSAPINRSLKIGYLKEVMDNPDVDALTKKTFQDTIKLLTNLGHELIPVTTPITEKMKDDFTILWSSIAYSFHKLGRILLKKPYDPTRLSKLTTGLSKFCSQNLTKLPGAISRLKKSNVVFKDFMEKNQIELLLTPVVAAAPPKIGHFGMNLPYETIFPRMAAWGCFTPLANVAGCPSISLPTGHDDTDDLPIGMLLNGKHGDEKTLLEMAFQIEEAQPWKQIHATQNQQTT